MQGISAPIIVTIITIILSAIKKSAKGTKVMDWIDLIGITLGALMGIIAYYCVPDGLLVSDNVFEAMLIGLFSGLSAIGADTSIANMEKMVKKNKDNKKVKQAQLAEDTITPPPTDTPNE